jgi:UDP:flavonoid glycosyltransferase YjiC (YdhE family)
VLTALAQSGFSGQAFVSGADTAMRKRIGKLGLEMHGTAVKPERIVGESAVIVHHGGSALAHLALAAGRPQLLFPAHLEHLLTARKLNGLGVVRALSGTLMASHVSEGLRQLMQDESFSQRAVSIAMDIHSRGPWDALKKIVASCQRLRVSQSG